MELMTPTTAQLPALTPGLPSSTPTQAKGLEPMRVGLLNVKEMDAARRRERRRLMALVVLVAAGGASASVFPTVGVVFGCGLVGLAVLAPLVWAVRIERRVRRRLGEVVPVTLQHPHSHAHVYAAAGARAAAAGELAQGQELVR